MPILTTSVNENLAGHGIAPPDPDQRKQHRQVLFQRRGPEMLVHPTGAVEEGAKVAFTDRNNKREADRRPDRIASADPVPESEYTVIVDAEVPSRL